MILLMRRQLGRNEQYLAKFELLRRALGDSDVSTMNRIERTAEEGEVHGTQCIRREQLR